MTIQEEKDSIKAFVNEQCRIPSIYTCWDPKRMQFEAFRLVSGRTAKLLSPADIERFYYQGEYADSDMFLIKAMHCFSYAPADCLLALVRYWKREDVVLSSREERPMLAIPSFDTYMDMYSRVCAIAKGGLVARYGFCPFVARPGQGGRTESVFKASGHAIGFYKKKLLENTMPYDPRDAYCNPEDVFAYCLGAYAVSAFLANPYVRKVEFKKDYEIDRQKHKVRAEIRMNPEGFSGDKEEDTVVIFEGITFRTNENLVTMDQRFEYNAARIRELMEVVDDRTKKYPTFLVLCAEDGTGLSEIAEIIRDEAPSLLGRTLLTTGHTLYAAEIFKDAGNVKKCFLSLDATGVSGATGLYFLDPPAAGGDLRFRSQGYRVV